MHTDVHPLHDVSLDSARTVVTAAGDRHGLPNVPALEQAVDTALLMWPRGNFAFNTPVPLPSRPRTLPVPTGYLDSKQIDLAWAHHGSTGGYKTPSLVGLYWSAPYLHDGGVSVGKNANTQLGLPGTVESNVAPDPGNSLRALIDRDLRARVIAANSSLQRMNVQGAGHNYWVDEQAGYTANKQRALILYLLTYNPPE